jgi:DNA-binding LacI/PurR family transcriptional regulator
MFVAVLKEKLFVLEQPNHLPGPALEVRCAELIQIAFYSRFRFDLFMRKRPIRLLDVARHLGLSNACVSMALRNHPKISKETRCKVKEAAALLGYRRDPLVSAHMSYVSRAGEVHRAAQNIAVLTRFPGPIRELGFELTSYPSLLKGIAQRAEELNFFVDEYPQLKGLTGKRLNSILQARGVQGVIIFPGASTFPEYLQVDWSAYCGVHIGHDLPVPRYHRVSAPHRQAMMLMLEQLVSRGYQRIGLALAQDRDRGLQYGWSHAFAGYQATIPASRRVPLIPSPDRTRLKQDLIKWIRRHRPDVIIGAECAILDWLREKGIHVPEDIGFACAVHDPLSTLSGSLYRADDLGREAVNQLASLVYQNQTGEVEDPILVTLGSRWHEGQTLRNVAPTVSVAAG